MIYAGFWKRAAAFVIDIIIMSIFIALVVFLFLLGLISAGVKDQVLLSLVAQWINLLVGISYFVSFEASRLQATPGKMLMRLRVTDLEGNRLTLLRATGRWFARVFCMLTIFVGYAMAGFTAKKQGLHDMVAGCLVICRDTSPAADPVPSSAMVLDKA